MNNCFYTYKEFLWLDLYATCGLGTIAIFSDIWGREGNIVHNRNHISLA